MVDQLFKNFESNIRNFNIHNMLTMARLAKLAYDDQENIRRQLVTSGAELTHFWDKDDTQAFLAIYHNNIILSFRGTQPDVLADWITDLKIHKIVSPAHSIQGFVHRGFLGALETVWDTGSGSIAHKLHEAISLAARDGIPKIFITGHSLGAALATLATSLCCDMVKKYLSGLYTFGSPRVGDANFCGMLYRAVDNQIFRVVNNNDIVTRIPTRSMGYDHTAGLWYLHEDGHITNDPSWWQMFLDRAVGTFYDIGSIGVDAVKDHSMENGEDGYIQALIKNIK